MASPDDEVGTPAPSGRKHERKPEPLEALDLQTPEGPLPGIPLGARNGKVPQPPTAVGKQTTSDVCFPCLIARGVMILILTGALIALVVIERRKAQAKESK